MANERATLRDRVIMEFGVLNQPFIDLIRSNDPQEVLAYQLAIAKVQSGLTAWRGLVREYCTLAPDVVMEGEYGKIYKVCDKFIHKLRESMTSHADDVAELQRETSRHFKLSEREFRSALGQVPLKWEAEIFDANTPFTAYLRIKEAISAASKRVDYFDRYLKVEFFNLFLSQVDRGVTVRLVTTRDSVNGVMDISKRAFTEFTDYQLVDVDWKDLHDRNLRVDNDVFQLGPGSDKAGSALTNFGPADSTADGHAKLDKLIENGKAIHT